MHSLLGDIKYTFVTMRRHRGFAVAALVTLALGIGSTTAVFSVVYGVLLRPLPYPESERLVRVYEEHPGAPRPPGEPPLTNATMYAWRARTQTVEGLPALLLIGAALLGRSFVRLTAVDAGYNPNNVLVARVYPAVAAPVERRRQFVTNVLDRVRADPRVGAARRLTSSVH